MKSGTMGKIILSLVLIIIISFGAAAVLIHNSTGSWSINKLDDDSIKLGSLQPIDENSSYSMQDLENISIQTVSAEVYLIPAESDEINIHLSGNVVYSDDNIPAVSLLSEVKDNNLDIEIRHKPGINMESSDLRLDIEIPQTYSHNISSNTVSGNVNLDKLEISDLEFESVSGNLMAGSLQTQNANFHTISGSVEIADLFGNLQFESTSGNIKASYKNFNDNIMAETISGNVDIYLPEDADFDLSFESVSGDINSGFPISLTHNSSREMEGIVGNGINKIRINTVSGHTSITEKNS